MTLLKTVPSLKPNNLVPEYSHTINMCVCVCVCVYIYSPFNTVPT
jgi:hypothetical protein